MEWVGPKAGLEEKCQDVGCRGWGGKEKEKPQTKRQLRHPMLLCSIADNMCTCYAIQCMLPFSPHLCPLQSWVATRTSQLRQRFAHECVHAPMLGLTCTPAMLSNTSTTPDSQMTSQLLNSSLSSDQCGNQDMPAPTGQNNPKLQMQGASMVCMMCCVATCMYVCM